MSHSEEVHVKMALLPSEASNEYYFPSLYPVSFVTVFWKTDCMDTNTETWPTQ